MAAAGTGDVAGASPAAAAALALETTSFAAPFTEKDMKQYGLPSLLPAWSPPSAWVTPDGANKPEDFANLFKAVVPGPEDWSPRERRSWMTCFRTQRQPVREKYTQYSEKQCVVEAARRAFFHVACDRPLFYGERGVTYTLRTPRVRGWSGPLVVW